MNARPLQLLGAPLTGTTLVEASAGTGKTYSIAWLYLRFLLEQRLPVKQILVVTFTEAAADELRSRIRARLAWMRTVLAGEGSKPASANSGELELLAHLVESCAAIGISREEIALVLDVAVSGFDEAAIYTVHGYCRRILSEFALHSRVPLLLTEPGNNIALQRRLTEDFWRREIHAGDSRRGQWLLRCFDNPQKLADAIRELLVLSPQAYEPQDPTQELIANEEFLQNVFLQLSALWTQDSRAHIEALFADKKYGLSRAKKDGTDTTSMAVLLAELEGYLSRNSLSSALPTRSRVFQSDVIAQSQTPGAKKAGKPLPQDALLSALSAWSEQAQTVARLYHAKLLVDASNYVRSELQRHEESSASLSFDGLIGRLHDALQGAEASRLVALVRARYPVALVDEFQDTDQRQYAIFRRLYAGHAALLMIGDAKQAIYGFRGGDVFAYAAARRDAQAQVFTLNTNFRAEPALSAAVNQLFRTERTFVVDFIDWHDVQAGGPKQGRWLQPTSAAVTFWRAEVTPELRDQRRKNHLLISASRLERKVSEVVASEIVTLLRAGAEQRLTFDMSDPNLPACAVSAGDIAVLVVNHKQAALVETALRQRGVAVSRRARENIFASDEAHELILLLRALLEPTHLPRLRAALATLLFGFDANALLALGASDDAWEATLLQFAALAARWQEQGILSLLLEILRKATSYLLPLRDGERRIANYLQLGELLDAASAHCAGPAGLLAWLQQSRRAPDTENKAQLLRLDSDAQAVQIVTIHSSKGLEYPIVFAPFLWKGISRKGVPRAPVISHNENYRVIADLGTPHFAARVRQHQLEEYAESIRLAYVACTRAINRLYLVWGTTDAAANSALLRLLDPIAAQKCQDIATLNDTAIAERLVALQAASHGTIDVCALPEPSAEAWHTTIESKRLQARRFTRSLFDARRTLSFTRLMQGIHTASAADHDAGVQVPVAISTPQVVVTSLLRGAEFGECLHQIFERIDFNNDDVGVMHRLVAEQVQRAGFTPTSEPQFLALVRATLNAELLPGLRLRTLPLQSRVTEMEFHFRLASGASAVLVDLAQCFPEYAAALQVLSSSTVALQGLMNGFIDLTLEHEGRFYVLDYKSNWLGPTARDYAPLALAQLMAQHRYDLQALIYQVALHRYLWLRLGTRYRSDLLGGALYVFVRGLDTKNVGAGVVHLQPPISLIESLNAWFDGE